MSRRAMVLGGAILMASLAGEVRAWECLSGSCPTWCEQPVPYGLTRASSDLGDGTTETEVRRGMGDWTLRSCTRLSSNYTGRSSAVVGAGDGRSVIGWVESGWRHSGSAIGVTGPRWDGRNCIREADMEMNGVNFSWVTSSGRGSSVNAYSIVLHEGGHYYGLGHSNDPNATMYFAYTGGIDALNADDEGGICTLYPGDGPVDCTVSGCPSGQECVGGECRPVMGDGTLCSPCTSDAECGGPRDFCIGYPSGGAFCGRACTSSEDCGAGFVCAGTSGGVSQCAGFDGSNFTCAGGGPAPAGCTNDSQCGAGERCNTATGACEPRPADRAALGESCESDDECNSGLCATTAAGQVCAQSCDGFDTSSCPSGFYCDGEALGVCGTGLCLRGTAGAAGLGASCTADTDCASLMCDGAICASPCRPDAAVNSCPMGYVCRPGAAAGCGACRAEADLAAPGEFCMTNEDCASGLCAVASDGDQFCTDFCDSAADCPELFSCVPVGDTNVCVPPAPREDGGGCGCVTAGAGSRSVPWLPLLIAGPAWVWWRRRR